MTAKKDIDILSGLPHRRGSNIGSLPHYHQNIVLKAMNLAREDERKRMESSPAPALTEEELGNKLLFILQSELSVEGGDSDDEDDNGDPNYYVQGHSEAIKAMIKYLSPFLLSNSREGKDGEGWIEYNWNKIESRPKETGKHEVYREGANKQHYETWNGSGWASNNGDITHYRKIVPPSPPKTQKP